MDSDVTREPATRPEDLARFLLDRLNAADVDGLVALYEPDGILALPGGELATGTDQLRAAFERFAAGRPFTAGEQQPTLRCGELALTSSRLPNGAVTAEIARRQPDGTWLWVIDQPNIIG